MRARVPDRLHRDRRREGHVDQADDAVAVRHRHREVHVLRPVQRAVSDRIDSSHDRVRRRGLLAGKSDSPLRQGSGGRVQAEEGSRDRPANRTDPESRHDAISINGRCPAARSLPAKTPRSGPGSETGKGESMLAQAIFYVVAALTVGSAMLVAFSRNIVYSTFALLGAFMGVVVSTFCSRRILSRWCSCSSTSAESLVLTIFAVMLTAGIADVTVSNRAVGSGAGAGHRRNRRHS